MAPRDLREAALEAVFRQAWELGKANPMSVEDDAANVAHWEATGERFTPEYIAKTAGMDDRARDEARRACIRRAPAGLRNWLGAALDAAELLPEIADLLDAAASRAHKEDANA